MLLLKWYKCNDLYENASDNDVWMNNFYSLDEYAYDDDFVKWSTWNIF